MPRSVASVLVAMVCMFGLAACKEEGGVKVKSFTFTGAKAVSEGQIKSVLATSSSSRIPWGTKHYFSREQFEADLKRIEAFYRDRGFPDARVASFDVKLSEDQASVKLTVNIEEGEPVRVEQMIVEGLEQLPEARRQALEQRLPLKVGRPLDRALLQASREAALDELKEHGHPHATVRLSEAPGSGPRDRIVTLHAEPGALARFGDVQITGNSSVSDRVIRRQLTFRPGQLYQESKLVESQRRLYTLELFQFASVKADTDEKAADVPARITVTEGKHRKLNLGFGYGSEEKARAEVDWRHVNFFGGAKTAGILARYSALDRGARVNFTEPYFFSRNYSLGLSAQAWHTDEPAFVLDTVGGRATINRRFGRGGRPAANIGRGPATTVAFTYINEWEDYTVSEEILDDPSQRDDLIALGLDPNGSGSGRNSAVSLDLGRDTTGNLLDARRGYFAAAHAEQSGGWLGGDFRCYETTLEGRFYQSLGRRAVLAVRARAGAVDGYGSQAEDVAVPFFKLYFLGGATTLRGWGRYEVSPLSEEGDPIGGQSLLNVSTEIRFPIVGKLAAVLFVDAGNVWANPWDFNLNDLRYDVGPGLRYNTPIGPVRVDLGYQLNRIPGLRVNGELEPRGFRVHFSIGQAF